MAELPPQSPASPDPSSEDGEVDVRGRLLERLATVLRELFFSNEEGECWHREMEEGRERVFQLEAHTDSQDRALGRQRVLITYLQNRLALEVERRTNAEAALLHLEDVLKQRSFH